MNSENKIGNFLGPKTFQICLIINGIVGPLLLGGAVATFFNGSNFLIDKGNITNSLQPVISRWANASHGLDALLDPWNVVLGLAVLMLARIRACSTSRTTSSTSRFRSAAPASCHGMPSSSYCSSCHSSSDCW